MSALIPTLFPFAVAFAFVAVFVVCHVAYRTFADRRDR